MRSTHYALLALCAVTPALRATLPSGFGDAVVVGNGTIATATTNPNFGGPTGLAFAPDGRLLITTQGGRLWVVRFDVAGTPTAFTQALQLGAGGFPALCSNSERGLLGVAVDPAFLSNNYLYLFYTFNKFNSCPTGNPSSASNPVNRIVRVTLAASDTVAPASHLVLADNIPTPNGNHNGGDLHFGIDGYLYASTGDGGCALPPASGCQASNANSRRRDVPMGKILRLNKADGAPPSDNPWFGSAGSRRCTDPAGVPSGTGDCQETWAWGLRNPFRFNLDPDPAQGGRMFINDVGTSLWEEIDLLQKNADYGFNVREGHCANNSSTVCSPANPPPAGMTDPIFDYGHSVTVNGVGCASITGGAFVPAGFWPAQYDGSWIYGDYVCGGFWVLSPGGGGWSSALLGSTASPSPTSHPTMMTFGPFGARQALYYTTYDGGGQVRKIDYTGTANRPPVAAAAGSPTNGAGSSLSVTFSSAGSGDPDGDPVTYDWDFGDFSTHATTAAPTHNYTVVGTYYATLRLTDSLGALSNLAAVRIDVGNTPPSVTMAVPAPGDKFHTGQSLSLSGSATDPQDGALPASSLSWEIILHHIDETNPGAPHTHPFLPPTAGNNLPFTGPAPEDVRATALSYLEVRLTATDSKGLGATVIRQFDPVRVPLTMNTNPAGLRTRINGYFFNHGATMTSWLGWGISLEAPAQLDGANAPWSFTSWSDGGAQTHNYATPAAGTTLTASYAAAAPPQLPNLLRGDSITALAAAPAQLPALLPLRPFGLNRTGDPGEGADPATPGTTDDDDFYVNFVTVGALDPDIAVLNDAGRPLVFYALDQDARVLRLSKSAGRIVISY